MEETQFCLKLKITFDPEVKRRTRLLEKNLESVLSERDKDEILNVLKARKTLILSLQLIEITCYCILDQG